MCLSNGANKSTNLRFVDKCTCLPASVALYLPAWHNVCATAQVSMSTYLAGLSIFQSANLLLHPYACLLIYSYRCRRVCPRVWIAMCLSVCLFVCDLACLFACVCMSVCLHVCMSVSSHWYVRLPAKSWCICLSMSVCIYPSCYREPYMVPNLRPAAKENRTKVAITYHRLENERSQVSPSWPRASHATMFKC